MTILNKITLILKKYKILLAIILIPIATVLFILGGIKLKLQCAFGKYVIIYKCKISNNYFTFCDDGNYMFTSKLEKYNIKIFKRFILKRSAIYFSKNMGDVAYSNLEIVNYDDVSIALNNNRDLDHWLKMNIRKNKLHKIYEINN